MGSRILVQSCRHELIEKNSRFIGLAFPCESLAEFKSCKALLEAEYPDATHITYAFKIYNESQVILRFSDAGEPAGTAGKPILMHIEGQNLLNLSIFVVRYYGGTKLGAGGLVRAYGNTTKQLLQHAQLADLVAMSSLGLCLTYSAQSQLQYLAKKFGATLSEWIFEEAIHCRLTVPTQVKESFIASLSLGITVDADSSNNNPTADKLTYK